MLYVPINTFSDMLGGFSGLIEKKITPLLYAFSTCINNKKVFQGECMY